MGMQKLALVPDELKQKRHPDKVCAKFSDCKWETGSQHWVERRFGIVWHICVDRPLMRIVMNG
jgi:predicted 3-demethylubiquinone-9 3-methyltransferase (glyoxalase superfamily)